MMNALVIFRRPATALAVASCAELARVPRPEVPSSSSSSNNQTLLVRVRAASLNVEDLHTATARRGRLLSATPAEDAPVTLGIEFAGEVVQAPPSSSSSEFKVGDRVMGLQIPLRVRHGCWAECVAVRASHVTRIPEGWSDAQAAAFPMSSLVARAAADCVVLTKKQQQQRRVAVVGASGGIGSILVRLLASKGVDVVAVCSDRNSDFVRSCGAKEVASRESGGLGGYKGEPLDYVLDCVGGDAVEEDAAKALKHRGHFVTVVGPGGSFGEVGDGSVGVMRGAQIAFKTLSGHLFGSYSYTIASMSIFGIAQKMKEVATALSDDCSEGPAMVSKTVPANDLSAVRAALDALAKHETSGRVVLDFSVFND